MSDIVNVIIGGFSAVVDFFVSIFEFFRLLATFFPNPFRGDLLLFLGIVSVIIVVKLVRGNG